MANIVTRIAKGSPLTPGEADANWTNLNDAVAATDAKVATAFNPDGTLKDNSVTEADLIDGSVTRRKLAANVAGAALEKVLGDTPLNVKVDGTTIQVNGSNQLTVPPANFTAQTILPQGILIEQLAAGTDAGGFTQNVVVVRALNAVRRSATWLTPLSGGQFKLSAGTYRCDIAAPAMGVVKHKSWLRNVTGSNATLLVGTSERSTAAYGITTHSRIVGSFTLAVESTLEVCHACTNTQGTDGLGQASGLQGVNPDLAEVYTIAVFYKEA